MITKEKRLLVYKYMLIHIEDDYNLSKSLYDIKKLDPERITCSLDVAGLCVNIIHAINSLLDQGKLTFEDSKMLKNIECFPELMAYKPEDKKTHNYWWSTNFYNEETRHKRIDVLEEIIKNLEQL